MTVLLGVKRLGLALAGVAFVAGAGLADTLAETGAGILAGPERLWLAQEASGNAGAMQMQDELENQLRRVEVDVPADYVMTLDQISQLNALFAQKEGLAMTRDQAKMILGLQ